MGDYLIITEETALDGGRYRSIWVELSARDLHAVYGIPPQIAEDAGNQFFTMGQESARIDDWAASVEQPWPLLALLRNPQHPEVLTLQIYTLSDEDEGFGSINVLAEPGGYLSLPRRAGDDLARLLIDQANRLPLHHTSRSAMFRQMTISEATDYRLHPDFSPNSTNYYYYQVYNPLVEDETSQTHTILYFSKDKSIPNWKLFLQIIQFPWSSLQDTRFQPLDHSMARIHVDRNGLYELALLLRTHLEMIS